MHDQVNIQRQREEEERALEEKKERRRREEETAMEEARIRKARDEQDWADFERGGVAAVEPTNFAPIANVGLTINEPDAPGGARKREVVATLHEGQHPADAAFQFCSAEGLHNHEEVPPPNYFQKLPLK